MFLIQPFLSKLQAKLYKYNVVIAMVAYLRKLVMTSQVTQVTWLIDQLINPNNLHVSRNLSILIVVLAKLEEKTKLTNYWLVYELVDDITTTSYHSHIIV